MINFSASEFSKFAIVFLLLLSFTLCWSPLMAYGNENVVVKIGYYENPPKLFGGLPGPPKGIFPEILQEIAANEDWSIEWIDGTWQEGLTRLESGEIDLMPDVAFSLKRAEKYAFSHEPVLVNWAVLYVRGGVQVNSLLDLEGKKVAVMRGSIHTVGEEGIKKQAENFNIHCEFKEFENYAEVFQALQNNLADVGVVNRLFGNNWQKLYDVLPTTIVFNPRHLKFAFPPEGKQTPYLKETIDKYLSEAKSQPESRIYKIIESYLYNIPIESLPEGKNQEKIFLTPEEKAWIETHPRIRIGIDPEFAPFEFIDKNGQYSGFASDYVRLLNERLGLNMVVEKDYTWKQVVAKIEKGEVDVLPAVGYTAERSAFLSFSTPYVGFHRMIFCRDDAPFISGIPDLQNLTVAVQAKSSHAGWIKDNTDLSPDFYSTLEETIRAVSEGKADVFIGNLAASTYWIRKLRITNLRVAAPVSLERQLLHMAVRKDWPILVDILNKGLASISNKEAEGIRNRWIAAGYTVGLPPWVAFRRAVLTLSIAALIVGIFLYWNWRLRKEIKRRKETEEDLRQCLIRNK